ncbi:MAG: hypothetical protein ACF8CQ_04255 [Rhodopirellula sp. JB044]|uniref:hypothetical protein n=1 Tax=Rhodopirellula sp. JB044 TaxID=3342844 RepID=UPI003709DD35
MRSHTSNGSWKAKVVSSATKNSTESGTSFWQTVFGDASTRIGQANYSLLVVGVLCQCVTIAITWLLWQARVTPPHLPTFDVPQFSFGWLLIASLVGILIRPRTGLAIHWGLLVVAAIFDQFRLQPQFFSIAVLMTACVSDVGHRVARWSLVSTWVWAGLHKLISPDWFGFASHWLVARSGFDADSSYLGFALTVALVELAVGVLAIFRPRWAAPACLIMHLGIALTISPFVLNWNESVLPWNLSVAVIGTWVMRTTKAWRPVCAWETAVCAVALIGPVGFYGGYVDHGFSGVLYSASIPQGLITTPAGTRPIEGWGELRVPFPKERRTIRNYFRQVAQPGDKLHLADPRPWLDDAFYVLDAEHRVQPINRDAFFAGVPIESFADEKNRHGSSSKPPEISGVGHDSRRSKFELRKAGVRMLRRGENQPIFAVEFTTETFDPALLSYLEGLPNLMQIQFAGTRIQDADLAALKNLRLLTGIGLDQTKVTDQGIRHLSELPFLQYVGCEETAITPEGLAAVIKPIESFGD